MAFYPENSRWELAFIGRNLTDQQRAIIVNGQTFTGTPAGTATSKPADLYGITNRPREVMVQLIFRPGQ